LTGERSTSGKDLTMTQSWIWNKNCLRVRSV
jgi:hypothetical protein